MRAIWLSRRVALFGVLGAGTLACELIVGIGDQPHLAGDARRRRRGRPDHLHAPGDRRRAGAPREPRPLAEPLRLLLAPGERPGADRGRARVERQRLPRRAALPQRARAVRRSVRHVRRRRHPAGLGVRRHAARDGVERQLRFAVDDDGRSLRHERQRATPGQGVARGERKHRRAEGPLRQRVERRTLQPRSGRHDRRRAPRDDHRAPSCSRRTRRSATSPRHPARSTRSGTSRSSAASPSRSASRRRAWARPASRWRAT